MTSNSRYDVGSTSNPPPPLTESKNYIGEKAKQILATREVEEIAKLVTRLCYGKETEESSKLLYKLFTKHFPKVLSKKLFQVYRFAPVTPKIRSFALTLLDSLLIDLEDSRFVWNTESLKHIKTHLSACLVEQETSDHDFKLLSRIVSRVAVDIFINNISWDELLAYMLSLNQNKRLLLIFSDLPMVLDEEFLIPLLEDDLHLKIISGLLSSDSEDEEWCLAFGAGFSLILQLVNLERKYLVWDLVYVVVHSVREMVNVKRREIVVRKGFMKLVKKVRREAMRFREAEYEVVSRLALMLKSVNGVCEATEMAAKMIHEVLDRYYMGGEALDLALINQSLEMLKSCK
ncbi:hypothetical protein V5N11_029451 [Cardamine amara subsp. amara]|uniref:DUF577 domain-containing protein n=1 Tax=Cardamine amara subsp. amara TaxID=228776 RepID=A0ABD1C1B1_CARAN